MRTSNPPGHQDIARHIQQKFKDYVETFDRARAGLPTPLVATPKDDKQAAIVARIRAGKFPERHIAALPAMDKKGMSTAWEVDDTLNALPGPVACLLWGDYGRGKTQIAVGVAMLRAQRSERTRYVNAVDLIRELKDGFGSKVPESHILRKYHNHPCLVIDDLHAALDDDPGAVRWARGQFQALLDTRYRTNQPLKTMLLVNASDATLLNSRIGGHILSRVSEDGKIIHVNSKNYRQPPAGGAPDLSPAGTNDQALAREALPAENL